MADRVVFYGLSLYFLFDSENNKNQMQVCYMILLSGFYCICHLIDRKRLTKQCLET